MHFTTLLGRGRIDGEWVENFSRPLSGPRSRALLWEFLREFSAGEGGTETGVRLLRQVFRRIHVIRGPWGRFFRVENVIALPKKSIAYPFDVFRLCVLILLIMAGAPCLLWADAHAASVSAVPAELEKLRANSIDDGRAPLRHGLEVENLLHTSPLSSPRSRVVLVDIFAAQARANMESSRPHTLQVALREPNGSLPFEKNSSFRLPAKRPLAMRRPKPGTLWLAPLDAWCGPGSSGGKRTSAVGCRECGSLPVCHFTKNEEALLFRSFAVEAQRRPNLRIGGYAVDCEAWELKGAADLPEWAPVALRQAGALVNEFRTESLKLDTSPSLADAREYFEDALGETPVEDAAGRLLFERWDDLDWGVSWRRGILSCLDGILYLDWLTNDDFGLSEAREFFEAPFFDATQTRLWYAWLETGGWHEAVVRGRRMGMSVGVRGHVVHLRLYW